MNGLISSPGFAFPIALHSTYLLQWRVWHTETAETDVHEGLLQFPKEAGVRSGLEVAAGEQIGQLLTNSFYEASLWHMMMDQSCDVLQVTWKRGWCSFIPPSLSSYVARQELLDSSNNYIMYQTLCQI